MNTRLHILTILLILFGAGATAYAQGGADPDPAASTPARVMILGNVYGGGELAQVIAPDAATAKAQLIQDADLADLFTTHADHVYTTYVHLGTASEVYGRVFGGGKGQHDAAGESAGRVTGQTDVALDGATVWSEIYGGGEMADVRGNTLLHFKKGKAGHNAFGGGLGKLGKRNNENKLVELESTDNLPDNRYEPLASADVKLIPANYSLIAGDSKDTPTTPSLKALDLNNAANWMAEKKTGESFVVFDGKEESDGTATYTHYEFEKARTVNRDANGVPVRLNEHGLPDPQGLYYTETDQFNPDRPEQLFSINHNIYGGGMTASKVEGKTFVHINYGMVNEEMLDFTHNSEKVWSMIYNSIANAQFCVFGGGYGYYTDILGDTNITMDVQGSGQYKYINEFTQHFATTGKENHHWDTNTGDPEAIYAAADEAIWSHGAPGRSAMDIVGGGYNGKVHGWTHVTVGGDVVLRKVYGGGYYSSVGNTDVQLKSGIFNRVYGGGLIGNVYGKATLNFGQKGDAEVHDANLHLMVKDAIYGGNDVSGTVGTTRSGEYTHTNPDNGVTYNVYYPVDDPYHGVRLNIHGGLVLGDVYGAGNGNHPGYGNPNYMEFSNSQHPSENYRKVIKEGENAITSDNFAYVYKYRPRTGRVEMRISGNDGKDFDDNPQVDKVRIWGRTFGGGNSCNVGVWDGKMDDIKENYSEKDWDFSLGGGDVDANITANIEAKAAWHPGDNFKGGGTIDVTIGNHVQLGNRNDDHETPNGLFMGCNGEHMVTQHLDMEKAKYYHQYYDATTMKYWPGFPVYKEEEGHTTEPISREAGRKSFKAFINTIHLKTDNVRLNIDEEAKDIWMSNFVGGGYRGSMQAATETGRFAYKLPTGVTIGHAVVGGAFNAHIIYRVYATTDGHTYSLDDAGNYKYETVEPDQGVRSKADAEAFDKANGNAPGTTPYDYIKKLYIEGHEGDEDYKTGYLRYNFDGGMLAHDSQMNSSSSGARTHQIAKASAATDFITPDTVVDSDDSSKKGGYNVNKDKALVTLDLYNRLDPVILNDGAQVHGGIVYGGCFNTGFVEGDVWVDYRCSLSPTAQDAQDANGRGKFYDKTNPDTYAHAGEMETHRALLVFGAGYGKDTHCDGDVYLRILHNGTSTDDSLYPLVYNAFGGGNEGTVAGNTNVFYNGGTKGTLLGSVYGGGYKGKIDGNTYLELAGGLAINAYGGSRQADIGGAAHVWVYDGIKFPDGEAVAIPENAPVLIGNLYGGNDISGIIGVGGDGIKAQYAGMAWSEIKDTPFNSYVQIGSSKTDGSRGFPLIGNLYAGGNGAQTADPATAPDVAKSLLHIVGGTTLRAFGGGNKATITDEACILVNAPTVAHPTHEFTPYQVEVLKQTVFKGIYTGYHWDDNTLNIDGYHAVKLYGGNNVATMAIQPKWNLLKGDLGSVYGGGNRGDMTYYNPLGGTTGHENEPKGLSITIDSDSINIFALYGGCRMANVEAKDNDGNRQTFGANDYGTTVNIKKGRIENVYGGNDVSGYVYNGASVNLSGSITGNVYAAGNGNYLYAYDKTDGQTHMEAGAKITEDWSDDYQKSVFWISGDKNSDAYKTISPLKQLLAINNARPHVAKSSLKIAGESAENKVYIPGAVYCGGNAATIRPIDVSTLDVATVKFNIGDNAIINKVFMGSNGESLKYDAFDSNNYIGEFEELNGINLATEVKDADWNDLTATDDKELHGLYVSNSILCKDLYPYLLSVYMRAVDMKALPLGFSDFSNHTFTNTWIGDFCMGGNAGSMMIDQPIDIVFPQSINLFGRIIGGCRDASFHYKGKWHRGGFRMPVASTALLDGKPTKTKLRMKIRGNWYSRRMVMEDKYKAKGGTAYSPDGDYLVIDKTNDGVTWEGEGKAWHDGCNVYGGCYESGDMVGDVQIYIESDMLAYSADRYDGATIDTYTNPQLDESNRLHLPVANIYGAGFGTESRNFGDAYIYMKDIPGNTGTIHPSVNNIFGGGRNGMLVGNSVIHVHDGLVYKDVVGGSFAAPLYGSSQVTVGYPKFYVCKKTGEYFLDRADKWNEGHKTKGNNRKDDVIKKSIKYFKGTYVPCNVYDQITGVKVYTKDIPGSETSIGDYLKTNKENPNDYFEFHDEATDASYFPTGGWDNVEIRVRGGVYGGGYSLSNSTSAVAGSYTTLASTTEYNHGKDGTDATANSSVGFGGNSSVIISDYMGSHPAGQSVTEKEHIKISTEHSGGVFGDGRLVFCEGFRAAEINGYGYATRFPDGVVTKDGGGNITSDTTPLELNTLQRFDLLTLNDCCMVLDGDPDFAADQMDGRPYSMARIGELRMNSSIDASQDFTAQRNYIGFKNNVHYLGAIVTNDDFHTSTYHDADGTLGDMTYHAKKQEYITNYHGKSDQESVDNFKMRNWATARNMVGLSSGYCLRVQNQYYEGTNLETMKTYYGPIVGVCEVKLRDVQAGEGGGYVYADNIHADIYDLEHSAANTFMNESGNFVFKGIRRPEDTVDQYIVDDCLPTGFDQATAAHSSSPRKADPTPAVSSLPEQHYWYIEGDKYFYNTTLTALSSNHSETFNLTKNDPNVIFAGIENGSTVTLESVKWQPATYPDGYSSDIRGGRDGELTPLAGSSDKYKFTLQIGDEYTWSKNMPRSATDDEQITGTNPSNSYTAADGKQLPTSPQFNVQLFDNVNNCPEGSEADYYDKHLSVPEQVKIVIKSVKGGVTKFYNVTLDIMYIQGPSYSGNVILHNCALPGEFIDFSSSGIKIQTTDQLPVTEFGWKLLPPKDGGGWDADATQAKVLPEFYYTVKGDETVEGRIPALYCQNQWNIAYTFKAGGQAFTVLPQQDEVKNPKQENRMLVVHNYHRMKDVKSHDRDLDPQTGARVYIEDEEDLRAFIDYLNLADGATQRDSHFYTDNKYVIPTGLAGLDIILQNDIKLTKALPAITHAFDGNFHGDGYCIDLNDKQGSLFGGNLTGKVYNLGLVGGTIATTGTRTNCYEYDVADDAFANGAKAYELSHYFTPVNNGYVEQYYANGDYQYARTDQPWSLRKGVPNYYQTVSHHDTAHTHDALRWKDTDSDGEADTNVPLYDGSTDAYANDYLFFGQHIDHDPAKADDYPMHINPVATGDADSQKGGNRVYKAGGYYRSKTDRSFYYNKDAWAKQSALTAIDFSAATEDDGAKTAPVAFALDSNADYDDAGHITQNLLVYVDEADKAVFAEGTYADGTPEEDIRYHTVLKTAAPSSFSLSHLHLVDKQDFNAPIAFTVNDRIWYERQPQTFRNVGSGYDSSTGWEGICLPFTAKHVVASTNGEISHFYGTDPGSDGVDNGDGGDAFSNRREAPPSIDSSLEEMVKNNDHTLHHEYWLAGFCEAQTDDDVTYATFSRPSTTGEGLFTDTRQVRDSYTYPRNDYFTDLPHYTDYYDSVDGDDDRWERNDTEWYASSHDFDYYVYLSASVPYLIAFPGNDFYEFSLEGTDYVPASHTKSGDAQWVTYSASNAPIGVSDGETKSSIANGHRYQGTYLNISGSYNVVNTTGTAFDLAATAILPFRTYMTTTLAPSPRRIVIRDGGSEVIEVEPEETPAIGDLTEPTLYIYAEGTTVVVESNYDTELRVYSTAGRLVKTLRVTAGTNRYPGFRPDIYIVGGKKIRIFS